MTTTSVHLGPPTHPPPPECLGPSPHPRQRALPPSCASFPFLTASFRHHLSRVLPTQWVLGGAGRNKAPAVPVPHPPHQQQGPPYSTPPPGLLHPLSSWAGHPFNTSQRWCVLRGGLYAQRTLYSHHWGVDNRARRAWRHWGPWDPQPTAPLSCRHHRHLPMGGLQPPGTARAGPVRHHLVLDPHPQPPLCCPL